MGHSYGGVTLWSPNMGSSLVDMLCHPSCPVKSISILKNGNYMVTTGTDSRMKVWDLRKLEEVYDYFTPGPAYCTDISQKGLLSVCVGSNVLVWKDWYLEKQKEPYMSHKVANKSKIVSCAFAPYEDFLGLGHSAGVSSITVPGSGEANFDAFEANPFESRIQKREGLVHQVMEKLQPSTIVLDQSKIGSLDTASKEIKDQERMEEMKKYSKDKKNKSKVRKRKRSK